MLILSQHPPLPPTRYIGKAAPSGNATLTRWLAFPRRRFTQLREWSLRASADEFGRNPEFITGIEVGGGRQVVGGADVGHRVEKFVVVGAGLTLI